MNRSSNASTERRNPMPKPFTTIVPPSFKAASETYQYAPAVGSAVESHERSLGTQTV